MRAFWAVYKRETTQFFRSNIAYAIAFGMLLFLGLLFASNVYGGVQANLSGFVSQPITADQIALSTLGVLTFLMFIIAPLLTMRLLAEENREGTLEVLMTLPMSDWSFVLGKYLAAWTFYTVLLLLTTVFVLLLSSIGAPDPGLTITAYVGAWLYGGAALALSMIWSAVTEDQIVAAFLGAATVIMMFLAGDLAQILATREGLAGASEFIRTLSLPAHYQDTMLVGVLRGEDIAYFVLLTIFALFLTTLIVGSRRWRAT
jgi:ABC-2 type transport system permease protein